MSGVLLNPRLTNGFKLSLLLEGISLQITPKLQAVNCKIISLDIPGKWAREITNVRKLVLLQRTLFLKEWNLI